MKDDKREESFFSVAHLTSVHNRYDVRIFFKECCSLATAGYDVSLVVADGLADEVKDHVRIISIPKPKNRLTRIVLTARAIYKKAVELDADVYHIHDPELLPIGRSLQKRGKKVVFDSHEDVTTQILRKEYIPVRFRRMISCIYAWYTSMILREFNFLIASTPIIRDKLRVINQDVIDINNYPILSEFLNSSPMEKKEPYVVYIGGLTRLRGIKQIIEALSLTKSDIKLKIAGEYSSELFRKEIKTMINFANVEELGVINRKGVEDVLTNAELGFVLLLPTPTYVVSLPVKMFEYMAAGIPVIASWFPLWKNIIEVNNCGICVDPEDTESIALAVDWLLDHPVQAREMGNNGKRLVLRDYNWKNEAHKLFKVYQGL